MLDRTIDGRLWVGFIFRVLLGLFASILLPSSGTAKTITEIIRGPTFLAPQGVAVDLSGNVHVAGLNSANVFRIAPGGIITEIIDVTGDGAGHSLIRPPDVAVDALGNVYVTSGKGNNVFRF